MTVLTQPRQTKLIPKREESQAAFVARANRELYRKIPDALKRNRYILRCWREAGRDGDLNRITAERFPEGEFQTIHDSPVFVEHSTMGADGQRRVYDQKALEQIVRACNHRILDTGDFAVLAAGHTPDNPTAANVRVPDVLGFCGPFRLGMIGNKRPRWAIFADEHYHRTEIPKVKRLPRRSAEVWLEDNILDPIAALGAETPRLDTGIIRNCRLPNGRTIQKYSAMAAFPGGMNTSVPAFGSSKPRRATYAAGDSDMQTNETMPAAGSDADALQGLPDEAVQRIVQGAANLLMQSKPMQWVQSQMPPDWTPGEGETDEVPAEETAEVPADDTAFLPEGDGTVSDVGGDTGAVETAVDDGVPPVADVGAATAAEYPEDEATPDELEDMDEEDKERYAAHDSAGRKGFLQAWRRHGRHRSIYSAGGGNGMPRNGNSESYSRLATENAEQRKRIDQLEARNRRTERYSRLAELHQTHAFDLDAELNEVVDLPQEQFERHCKRIKENYARLPVARGGFSPTFPVEPPEVIRSPSEEEQKVERYSRRAMEIANAAIKANPKVGISWDEAMAKAREEIDGGTVAAK